VGLHAAHLAAGGEPVIAHHGCEAGTDPRGKHGCPLPSDYAPVVSCADHALDSGVRAPPITGGTMKRSIVLGSVVALMLAACGGQGTQSTASAATDDASEPPPTGGASGGTLTIGLFQEPDNLNPYLAVQTASRLVREVTLEGLVSADADGNYIPELAAEVPTTENGGISEDGLTITYTLKEGITWSDGDPFTSADVKFTWEAIMDPGNAVNSQTGYELIESIETPDDTTVVVTFSQLYAPALSLFSIADAVLPQHVLEGEVMGNSDFSRTPEGTGPFIVTEWTSGDSIILDRNPNYREDGQPILDRIVFKVIPDQQAGIAQLQSGEVDALWNLDESSVAAIEGQEGIDLQITPSSNVEYLGLNLSARGTADASQPHPVLGDEAVRQALSLAIDRTPIVDELLGGRTEAATSPIGLGWAAPEGLELPPTDPEQAMQLLEEAGWTDEDGDGIREKDGTRLSLEITTPAGQAVREQTEQVLQEQFSAIGVELTINNVPAATLFGNWDENGMLKRGDFDIVMDTWGADLDPAAFLSTLFKSDQIPSEENAGEGWNFFRLQDEELDAAIDAGSASLDQDERRDAYRVAVERILDDLVYIPLYKRAVINAFASNVAGEEGNPWDEFTWNAEAWSLSE
jgi:peptide/nickel transport system substrate-binding protein